MSAVNGNSLVLENTSQRGGALVANLPSRDAMSHRRIADLPAEGNGTSLSPSFRSV